MATEKEIDDSDRYTEYWAYLRHIESTRLALVGAVITAAAVAVAIGSTQRWTLWAILFVNPLIGFFLVFHKRSYNHYQDELREMDPGMRTSDDFSAFEVLLILTTLVQVFVTIGLVDQESSKLILSLVIALGIIFSLAPWFAHRTVIVRKLRALFKSPDSSNLDRPQT